MTTEKKIYRYNKNLEEVRIPYFDYEEYPVLEIEGIKIGLAGITGWNDTETKKNIEKATTYFQEQNTDLIILTFHWGIERESK